MNMVLPNEGKTLWLARVVDTSSAEDLVVELFRNNYTPTETDTLSNYLTPSFAGYAPVTLTSADWITPYLIPNLGYLQSINPPRYDCTGGVPEIVYGWFMYGATTTKVYAAQRFDTPRTMAVGLSEVLTPFRFALKTLV